MSNQRIALVSGASRGIGREIARQLVEDHGFVALAGARDPSQTNLFGAWRLAQPMVPLLLARDDPRIVNISSGMGQLADMGGGHAAYRVSKARVPTASFLRDREAIPW